MKTRSGVLGELADTAMSEYKLAKQANIDRYREAKSLYEENLSQYQPGGAFGRGFEEQLKSAKLEDVGRQTQHQISSGLWGVQSTGAIGSQWEKKVGAPARLQLADMRMGKLAESRKDLAGVIERREDEYPDFRLIADLYQQAAASGGGMSVRLPYTKDAGEMYNEVMRQPGTRGASTGSGGFTNYGGFGSFGGGGSSYARPSYSGYSTGTTGGVSSSAPSRSEPSAKDLREGYLNWWKSLSKGDMKRMGLTGAMGPSGYLSYAGQAIYKGKLSEAGQYEQPSYAGTAYGDYRNIMESRQPGAVTATQDEYQQIVSNLNRLYGSPTGISGR